jgi:hypothetical protein
MRSLVLLLALSSPSYACPAPPPPVEMLANDQATIAPDGGAIVRIERGHTGTVAPRGKLTRELIAYNLYVLHPQVGAKTLEVVRDGKVVNLPIASSPALAAPTVTRIVASTSRDQPGGSQVSIELDADKPADAYTLVIYKVDRAGARSVAHGVPNKRVVSYSTGGKNCYGNFESIYIGERIAVAWLDVHGKVSARSATFTVGRM